MKLGVSIRHLFAWTPSSLVSHVHFRFYSVARVASYVWVLMKSYLATIAILEYVNNYNFMFVV